MKKILEHQVKQLARKETTHRLCTRRSCWKVSLRPEVLTDEDVDILKQAFSQSGMKEIVAESVARVAGILTEQGRNYTTGRAGALQPCRGLPAESG